jgi:hypothetical protein
MITPAEVKRIVPIINDDRTRATRSSAPTGSRAAALPAMMP